MVWRGQPRGALRAVTARVFFLPPSIAVLLRARRPAAILGRVWAVVVDAVNGVPSARPWPHVGQEIREVLPALANFNPSSSVVLIRGIVGIAAAFTHLLPRVELRMGVHAVLGQASRRLLDLEAFTASRFPVSKTLAGDGALCAAVAAAEPHRLSRASGDAARCRCATKNGPAAEPAAGYVDQRLMPTEKSSVLPLDGPETGIRCLSDWRDCAAPTFAIHASFYQGMAV